MVGIECFLFILAQYKRYKYYEIEFTELSSTKTVNISLFVSILFSSTLTSFYKFDKKNLAKKPL